MSGASLLGQQLTRAKKSLECCRFHLLLGYQLSYEAKWGNQMGQKLF